VRRRPSATDFLIAVVAVALDLSLFTQLSDDPDQTSWVSRDVPPAMIIGAGLIAVIPLTFRRRAPTAVCLIMAGQAALLTVTLGSRPLVSVLVALYTAAVWSDRVRARVCLAAVLAAHAVAVGYEASFAGPGLSAFAVTAVALVYGLLDVATWAAGRWGSSAAARARTRELEASRSALAAAAVDAERLRIARELHDIVAHAVTVMVLQSAGASRMAVKNPELAADAMRAVENTGKQAVAELRRLLEVLRAEDTGDTEGDGAVEQPHGTSRLANLDDLAAQIRSVGIDVTVEQTGTASSLDPSVDLTAYRVIQEALTNVNKHAGAGAAARVRLSWEPSELVIEVVDDGQVNAGIAHLASGYGLVGLAERVKLVGGRLESGPRPEGGFRVRAVLPTSGSEPADAVADARGKRSWTS
jgi:signal transduction histidine kinase